MHAPAESGVTLPTANALSSKFIEGSPHSTRIALATCRTFGCRDLSPLISSQPATTSSVFRQMMPQTNMYSTSMMKSSTCPTSLWSVRYSGCLSLFIASQAFLYVLNDLPRAAFANDIARTQGPEPGEVHDLWSARL